MSHQGAFIADLLFRNHRERKEAYIKSLELEVVQLRANEARLSQETKALYTEIRVMKNLLVINGIPVPSPPPQSTNDDPAPQDTEDVFEFSISTVSTVSSKTSQEQERINVVRQTRRKKSGYAGSTAHHEDQSLGVYMRIPIAFISYIF